MTSALDDLLGPAETIDPGADWPLPLQHLSASSIKALLACPEQFRRQRIHGEWGRSGYARVWGSAHHYASEVNYRQKIVSGVDLPEDDVASAFAEGFDKSVDECGGRDEIAWDDTKPTDIFNNALSLVKLYHRKVAPTVQPVAVEERFEVRIPNVPVPVVGYIDVETDSAVIDQKTTAAKSQTVEPQWAVQAKLYQSVAQKPYEFHISTRTKTPAVYTPADFPGLRMPLSERAAEDAQRLVQTAVTLLLTYWDHFGPDEVWPGIHAQPCKWCVFGPFKGNGSCAWWRQ